MNRAILKEISGEITLLPKVDETIKILRENGIKLYILSGSIKGIIKTVIGSAVTDFEEIRANDMQFDDTGYLKEIIGTAYDFEGKADYIKSIINTENCSPMDVLFVGNSCNDVWASRSGARTLCVNPSATDPDNLEQWTYCIRELSQMDEILKYVNI